MLVNVVCIAPVGDVLETMFVGNPRKPPEKAPLAQIAAFWRVLGEAGNVELVDGNDLVRDADFAGKTSCSVQFVRG